MNEIIKSITDVGILVTIAGAVIYLLFKYFDKKIGATSTADPKNHDFFNKIQYDYCVKLSSIRLHRKEVFCPMRTAMFKKMLHIKLKIWREEMMNAVNSNYKDMTDRQLLELFSETIINIITKYEAEWKQQGIPDLVISKFNSWHSPHVEMFSGIVNNICMGRSFQTTKEQVNAILELHNALLVITLLDTEKTLGELNGELSQFFKENEIREYS